jgi:hypothetical protein
MDANQINTQISKFDTRAINTSRILQEDMRSLLRRRGDTQMAKVKASFRLAKASLQEIHIFTEKVIELESSGKFPEELNFDTTITRLDRVSLDLENVLDEQEKLLRDNFGKNILMERGFSEQTSVSDSSEWPEEDEYGSPIETKPRAVIDVHPFDPEKDISGGKKKRKLTNKNKRKHTRNYTRKYKLRKTRNSRCHNRHHNRRK